jgi:hypothetical protein
MSNEDENHQHKSLLSGWRASKYLLNLVDDEVVRHSVIPVGQEVRRVHRHVGIMYSCAQTEKKTIKLPETYTTIHRHAVLKEERHTTHLKNSVEVNGR